MADAYLTVTVRDLPVGAVFFNGALRPNVAEYVRQGVVKVVAGPEQCHVTIDIRRPYNRPERLVRLANRGTEP